MVIMPMPFIFADFLTTSWTDLLVLLRRFAHLAFFLASGHFSRQWAKFQSMGGTILIADFPVMPLPRQLLCDRNPFEFFSCIAGITPPVSTESLMHKP
jgi:hypothetical protein